MKQIAQEQKYILLIAPVGRGRPQQSVAEGKAFPLLIVLFYLFLEKLTEELYFKSNAIQYAGDWDGFASSMASFDTWSGVITSGAGSLVTNSLSSINSFDGNKLALNGNTFNTDAISKYNSLVGGLASSALSYGLTGEATFNVLNIADIGINSILNKAIGNTGAEPVKASCGLLEVSVGNDGVKTRLGTGGIDISYGTVLAAYTGLKESARVTSWKYGGVEKSSTLNSINMLGYTQNEHNKKLSKDIWNEKLGVEYGDTGKDYGNYTVGEDKIRLSDKLLGGGKEGSAKLAAVMSHESTHYYGERREALAHLNGLDTYSQINKLFKLKGDSALSNEMLAGVLNAENWKENSGDVDHWTMMSDGRLAFDGSGNLYDENGNLMLKTDKGIQGGLEQILGITPEQARQMIENSGFDSVPGSWNVKSNYGKSIDFDSETKDGLSYGEIYDNQDKKISDYLTGQEGTLKELNPKNIYDNMVSNGTMDVKDEYKGILGGLKALVKGESKYISYEEYRDNNYITGGMPTEGIDYNVGEPLNVKDGNYNLITTMFRAEGDLGIHYGIDLSAVENTKVYAMLFDEDTTARFYPNSSSAGGNYTGLEMTLSYNFKGQQYSDSILQRYMHLNSSTVPNGTLINESTNFALSGNTGTMTTAAHLHIDISSSKSSPWLDYLSKSYGYKPYNKYDGRTYYAPEMFLKNYKWKNENAKYYNN